MDPGIIKVSLINIYYLDDPLISPGAIPSTYLPTVGHITLPFQMGKSVRLTVMTGKRRHSMKSANVRWGVGGMFICMYEKVSTYLWLLFHCILLVLSIAYFTIEITLGSTRQRRLTLSWSKLESIHQSSTKKIEQAKARDLLGDAKRTILWRFP